jgi:hypothetical protein
MQKYREIGTDRTDLGGHHRFRAFADHHPVTVARSKTEQGIAYRTADQIGFHRRFFFAGASPSSANSRSKRWKALPPEHSTSLKRFA